MKLSRKLLIIGLVSMLFVLNICPIANAYTHEIDKEDVVVGKLESVPDALDSVKEQEALEDYLKVNNSIFNSADGLIKLSPNEPIVLNFEDGSSIVYSLIEHEEPIYSLNRNISPQSTKKTYTVVKTYFYLIGNANIYLTAECTQDNRRVTIDRAYDKVTGSLASVSNRKVSIIRKNGYNNTYAIAEASGDIQFEITKLGPWLFRTYRIQIHVDPAGSAYLKVLD